MKIIDFYKDAPVFSVEVQPPRNGTALSEIYNTLDSLTKFGIKYISITNGMPSNLRGGTVAIAALIKQRYHVEVLAHLTCIGSTPHEIENSIVTLNYLGIENILALRGDPPYGEPDILQRSYYKYAADLIVKLNETNAGKYLLRKSDIEFKLVPEGSTHYQGTPTQFGIAAACYPEKHIDASTLDADIDNVKRKVDLGAAFLITQMFFNNDHYWRYLEALRKHGITVPVVPGLKPVSSYGNIDFLMRMFHCEIPASLRQKAEQHKHDVAAVKQIGIEHTIAQCEDLLRGGAPGVHFYTMNKDAQIKEAMAAVIR